MFKIIIACFCVLSLNQISAAYSANNYNQNDFIDCAPQLQHCLKAIQKVPEAKNLLAGILQEGPIRIAASREHLSEQFGAFWDVDRRIICVNLSANRTEGELIGSILFEMHNASVNSKLNQLDNLASSGKIDRESYVQAVERLEYYNSVNASAIAEKGIRMGVFPPDARLQIYSSFEEHYRFQKIGGHSAWIAKNYDQLAPNL